MPYGFYKILRVDLSNRQTSVEHYEMRGWDKETGAPTAGKLHELGIGWVAKLLYQG